jgi:hypothetical protein
MYRDRFYVMENRTLCEQDFAERVAERNRYARSKRRFSLRARLARRLFALAVAADRIETWRLVWEKLEARGRFYNRPPPGQTKPGGWRCTLWN